MRGLWRWLALVLLALAALQIFFLLHIALMAVVDPQSTAFQRSEMWRISQEKGRLRWRQEWVGYGAISDHLKRAVIASEDGSFSQHEGVDWEALEKAWQRNAVAEQTVVRRNHKTRSPRIIGGSTITQQLAKNLLLSGERTLWRKGQEVVLAFALERLLSKERILEIYLNHVEWGEGVFGAEAAAQHYFRKSASRLTPYEAARLSVMLPRPRYFEKVPHSGYLASRASTIVARMQAAEVP